MNKGLSLLESRKIKGLQNIIIMVKPLHMLKEGYLEEKSIKVNDVPPASVSQV